MISEPRSAKTSGAPRRKYARQESVHDEDNEPSLEEITTRALEDSDFDLVTQENAQQVMARLRAIQKEAMANCDYEKADLAEIALRKVAQVKTQRAIETINNAETEDMEDKLMATNNDLDYLKQHWRDILISACTQRDEELDEIARANRQELKEFDNQVNYAELPLQFRKMSPEYLQLRRRQKAMIASKRYMDAKEVKREADAMEKKELDKNYERFRLKAEADRKELIKKQQEKMDARSMNWERKIAEIRKQAKFEVDHAQRCADHLQGRINEREQLIWSTAAVIQGGNDPAMMSRSMKARSVRSGAIDKRRMPTANSDQLMFRQRAMINKFTYSKVFKPGSKPGSKPRTARRM